MTIALMVLAATFAAPARPTVVLPRDHQIVRAEEGVEAEDLQDGLYDAAIPVGPVPPNAAQQAEVPDTRISAAVGRQGFIDQSSEWT